MNSAQRSIFKFKILIALLVLLLILGGWHSAVGLVLFFAGFPLLVFGAMAVAFMAVELKKHFEIFLPFKMLVMLGMALLGVLMILSGIGLVVHDLRALLHLVAKHV